MLSAPDLKACYVAAALAVIEAELRNPDADSDALAELTSGVARVARELANEKNPPRSDRPPIIDGSNVVAFRR
jgi:hypothetical protein